MLKAVIFDMDGLLIDSEAMTFKGYKKLCSDHSYKLEDEFYFQFLGTNIDYMRDGFHAHYGQDFPFDQILEGVHSYIEEIFQNEGVPLKPGAMNLFNFLKRNSIKIGLATSSARHRVDKILAKAEITSYFDVTVCGDEITHSKPNPEIFLTACQKLGVKPEEAIVLEDSENGIIGASDGKIQCIHVPDLKASSDVIKKRATYIAKDLNEVIHYIKTN